MSGCRQITGVIGGAGVAATNKLCELMEISGLHGGAFRDAHHPEMIIFQATQAPSRSMFLEGKGESYLEAYLEVARKLQAAGATKIAMCCNTAHWGIGVLERESGLPFINLVRETVLEARTTGGKTIGLLASDGCLKGNVYEPYFADLLPACNLLYPPPALQREVTRGICNIKNKARLLPKGHADRPESIFQRVAAQMFEAGAELLLIGCTDIRVDFSCANSVDSLEVLAKCIIREFAR